LSPRVHHVALPVELRHEPGGSHGGYGAGSDGSEVPTISCEGWMRSVW
jgi:hypothetical protein